MSVQRGWIGDERGSALLETALTFPLVLLLSVSVFEFGRAFQHWQILTNAAREGARVAVLPGTSDEDVSARVQSYLESGRLAEANSSTVAVVRNDVIAIGEDATASASTVTISYPFEFVVLRPLMQLIVSESTVGEAITMTASATMRNE
ncbi:MAG: pilus assembly protein [Acidobacteria bacterium]|nr:pilus assembly protein [Acidobacteriota bacterium]